VLITLGIIGVVAALTIPNVIANFQEKQSVVAFKKVYSELLQVHKQLNYEYGDNWTYECATYDNKCFRNLFASKLKIVKTCENSINERCQINSVFLDKTTASQRGIEINNGNWPALITTSGYSVKFRHVRLFRYSQLRLGTS
jgi:type II secretory pathway pseudopilin PulG